MEPTCFYWQHHKMGPLLGIGKRQVLQCNTVVNLEETERFFEDNHGNYIFGYISFDVKNSFEKLTSNNADFLQFPLLHFWVPESLFQLDNSCAFIWGSDNEKNQLEAIKFKQELQQKAQGLHAPFKARTTKQAYTLHFDALHSALQRGDIYEVNYCQEFYSEECQIERPVALFGRLNELTKAPHATYVQTDSHLVFCASPERFIQKKGTQLTSEPIKGTAARSKDKQKDLDLAQGLKSNPKERSENIMIVDLVRNDLSQIAIKNSVRVDELCEIYSFETVHQMISKISCELAPTTTFAQILKACFPMGSMTGAPKIEALKQIEQHEDFRRGLYSGSIGLIEPNGDFDFNVVIRSLLYNRISQYLSCSVGSAITIEATAEAEYQECLLKAEKLIHGLQ